MSRTERKHMDWNHYVKTGEFRIVETSHGVECGCKICTRVKRFYKRLDNKRKRREAKTFVRKELTNPEAQPFYNPGTPREVLQDRKGYSSVDLEYFENFIMADWYEAQEVHRRYDDQLDSSGKYSTEERCQVCGMTPTHAAEVGYNCAYEC